MEMAMTIADGAVEYWKKRQEAKEEQDKALQIINKISAKIEQAKEEIINEIRYQRTKDLEGDLVGIASSLKDYAAMSSNANPLNHLQEVLSQSAQTFGDLTVVVQDVEKFKQAKEMYPLYITGFGLYVTVLEELKYRFTSSGSGRASIDNRIKDIRNGVISVSKDLIKEGGKVAEARFGEIRIEQVGGQDGTASTLVGNYYFDGDIYGNSAIGVPPPMGGLDNMEANAAIVKAKTEQLEATLEDKKKRHIKEVTNETTRIFRRIKEKLEA